jgi:hypothetical protein
MHGRGKSYKLGKVGWGVCFILLLTTLAPSASAEPRIDWQVENPFRLFLDSADTEVHRATWASLSDVERVSPVLPSATATPAASGPTTQYLAVTRSAPSSPTSKIPRPSTARG